MRNSSANLTLPLLAGALLLGAAAPARSAPTPAESASVVKQVFTTHCLECHGGSRTQARVAILDQALLLKKRKVVPGNADGSVLYQPITATDESVMPPAGQPRLSAEEIEAVRQWIAAGAAPFPDDVALPAEDQRPRGRAGRI